MLTASTLLSRFEVAPRDLGRRKAAVEVPCQSFDEPNGGLGLFWCIPPNNIEDQRVTRNIVRALDGLTARAARVDGVQVRALLSFTAVIECPDEDCDVRVVPNHRFAQSDFGDDYSAPQPIVAQTDWYAGFADKREWIEGWMPNVSRSFNHDLWPLRLRVAVPVAADGSAVTGCIAAMRGAGDDHEQRNRLKLEAAMAAMGSVEFIPGMTDGRPVAMRYYEYVIFRDAAQRVTARRLFDQAGRIGNRFYPRLLAGIDEAPQLYCAARENSADR